ncbi:MAG: TRAP transporter small permease subunit [Rhodobiaceae bacterium]|nr:TRAP transporter small permease subunit [Rhodobiaceae bacterium]MCC0053228.1 TRAP transporter small permease subunit [Rhodobiaceae bacterium]
MMLGFTVAFVLNAYLSHWRDFPGASAIFSQGPNALSAIQAALTAGLMLIGALYVLRSRTRSLRDDSRRISDMNAFFIRAAFWSVVLVGLADTVISFLRVEGMLEGVFGSDLSSALGRSNFRGTYVHIPLILASIAVAWFVRSLGFYWLALLVVVAELLIVIGRFIFSYEQAFMADLVRFWYAALFLFASAYTLLEEGHVRVDVFYTGLSARTKGLLNASGTLLFGIPLCWVILVIGAGTKQSIIVSPLLSFEVTQAGFGMYVKYLMAGFLAVFAISMLVQFISYLLDAVADVRGDPGGREHESHATA